MSPEGQEFVYKKPDDSGFVIRYKPEEKAIGFIVFEVEFADFEMDSSGVMKDYTIENEKEMFECEIDQKGASDFHFAHGIEFDSPKDYGAFVDLLNQLYGIAEKLLGDDADFSW